MILYLASFVLVIAQTVVSRGIGSRNSLAERASSHVFQHELPNANHIFNAVQDSMRQWGSSWHHNGMSFFLARVPQFTKFYHGTGNSTAVEGMDWLAFEPEHALIFAHKIIKVPPYGPYGPKDRDTGSDDSRQFPLGTDSILTLEDDDNHPHKPQPIRVKPGFLHTYVTKHALSLLYIDGTSGGKSTKGTLDSQDYILRNENASDARPFPGDYDRAHALCHMAKHEWEDKIDGFIRMETGFEVILCEFEKHLDLVRAAKAERHDADSVSAWVSAASSRYQGIGGERVRLDYDNFVTAYAYDLDLLSQSSASPDFPRLRGLPQSSLDMVRHDVDKLVLNHDPAKEVISSINWQAKAGLMVTRYSKSLQYWSTARNSTQARIEIALLMRPYIDADARSFRTEVETCTNHFLPSTESLQNFARQSGELGQDLPLAYHALRTVSHRICNTLFSLIPPWSSVSDLSSSHQQDTLQSILQSLVNHLAWSSFADCPESCALDEVCFIPMWPLGLREDRAGGHGHCKNACELRNEAVPGRPNSSYWSDGDHGPPPAEGVLKSLVWQESDTI